MLLSLLTSLSLTAQTPQQKALAGSVVDEVIWTVGDEPILKSEIENQKLYMRSQGMPLEGNPDCYLTEQLAVQMLFLNQAKIDSISVDKRVLAEHPSLWGWQRPSLFCRDIFFCIVFLLNVNRDEG